MPTHDPHDPKLDPKEHFDEASVREGYEVSDANTGGIMVFLVGLFISVGVFFVVGVKNLQRPGQSPMALFAGALTPARRHTAISTPRA